MLQFWKRSSGHKEKTKSVTPPSSPAFHLCGSENDVTLTSNNFEASNFLTLDDEGLYDLGDVSTVQSSRLSKSLLEVLTDKSALGYFIQYLDAQDALSYVRCWLDIESFRSAAVASQTQQDDNLLLPLSSSRLDHDSLSVSTECDSSSNSLYDFSSSAIDCNNFNKMTKCESSVTCDTSCRLDSKNLEDANKDKSSKMFIDDAFRIFKKYIAQEAPNFISCPEDLRNEVSETVNSDNATLNPTCFDKIQKFVFGILEQRYFNGFVKSHYNCKYQIDVLTSGNIVLQDILYNQSILFYFMEYLEQESSRNLLEFWLAATNFRQQLIYYKDNYNPEEAQNDAVILYDKYFSLQATCPLGFGDKIRFMIEENICREDGPQSDCFCQPIKIVEHVLEKNYLKPFLSSQLYFKYLSELISTVQTQGCNSSLSRSRSTYSDCSSEISSPLTAEDQTMPKRMNLNTFKSDMNIETSQLYNPDLLWKRRRTRRLSFGRVTDLGRFETDVEPEPDRKTESRITRAVKRLVHLEEHKTKEEMAWQVAEMIVKDITSITLADSNHSMHS